MIHQTAVIDPRAELDSSVSVGPYAVIEAGVTVGADCVLGPHVHLLGSTRIGKGNRFHAGCVIGDAPQDLKYHGQPTKLEIGDGNIFREHVTVHRSNSLKEATVIGSNNFLMANSHVGHNCVVADSVILANGALLGGHVVVGNRVFVSGNCLVHQFVRIGRLAFMQGGSAISKDLPPFAVARGDNGMCGLNIVGLRRAGIGLADRTELKRLYHRLFRTHEPVCEAVAAARPEFTSPAALEVLEFVSGASRGICRDTGVRKAAAEEEE